MLEVVLGLVFVVLLVAFLWKVVWPWLDNLR